MRWRRCSLGHRWGLDEESPSGDRCQRCGVFRMPWKRRAWDFVYYKFLRRLRPRYWRYSRGDGLRLIPKRPCGDDNHCWRCQRWWWSCGACDGLEPDFVWEEIPDLSEGSWGMRARGMGKWYHGPDGDTVTVHEYEPWIPDDPTEMGS